MTTALVLGRAESVWEEVAAAKALGPIDFVLVTGPIGVDYPDAVDCWVWFHEELFQEMALRRAAKGYLPAKSYWSVKYRGKGRGPGFAGIPVSYLDWNEGGSSGMVAVMIALRHLEVDRVMLAGVPMTVDGGRYDDHQDWKEALAHQPSWENSLPLLMGKVRSFSGWTRELLGGEPPTAEWLAGKSKSVAA
jgi:hypothetical protein